MSSTPTSNALTGFRQFSLEESRQRQQCFRRIEKIFEQYGFEPLEGSCMLSLSNLLGNYGDEGDRLLYKVLNSGDFMANLPASADRSSRHLLPYISNKGLRYDLTLPLAQYVATHRHQFPLPIRRYQIGPVWRADRPQKGRYREFIQCDVDIVGSTSLFQEAELLQVMLHCLDNLQLPEGLILLNHRLLLEGVVASLGLTEKKALVIRLLDKLDKIGYPALVHHLLAAGMAPEKKRFISRLQQFQENAHLPIRTQLDMLQAIASGSERAQTGLEELKQVVEQFQALGGDSSKLCFRPTLARGMAYYTGTIWEAVVPNESLGSVGGGGRYDNLTAGFGLPGISGVGFSLGIERIYDLLVARNKLPAHPPASQLLLLPICPSAQPKAIGYLGLLRNHLPHLKTILFPYQKKWKKGLQYAERKKIPYVGLIGETEVQEQSITIKDLRQGHQETYPFDQLLNQPAPCSQKKCCGGCQS